MRGIQSYLGRPGSRLVVSSAAGRTCAMSAAVAAVLLIAGCGSSGSQGAIQFGPNQPAASAAGLSPPVSATPAPAQVQPITCSPARSDAPAAPAALPEGYHRLARPATDLCAALAAARKGHQEVLLDFGANWCVDCKVLLRLFRSLQVAPLLERDYRVVPVDVGQWNLNLRFAARYVTLNTSGIPALVVLTSAGKVRVNTDDGKFEHARAMDPQQVRVFLTRWAPARA
jgi:thiol:disulfide interchange protein